MKKLNPDSGAFRRLQDIIGAKGTTRLKDLKNDGMRIYQIEVLLDYGYIIGMAGRVTVTQAGHDYVDEVLRSRGERRQVEVQQTLDEQINRPYVSIRSTVNARPYRPGAEDYKNVPSLFTANVVEKKTVDAHGNSVNVVEIGTVIRKLPSGEVLL